MDNKLIIGLMLGRVLGVVSSFNRLDFRTEYVQVFSNLGLDLINTFIYELYKGEKSNLTLSE
jgi:hypothetical protein